MLMRQQARGVKQTDREDALQAPACPFCRLDESGHAPMLAGSTAIPLCSAAMRDAQGRPVIHEAFREGRNCHPVSSVKGEFSRALEPITARHPPPRATIRTVTKDDGSAVPAQSRRVGRGDSACILWTVRNQPGAGPGAACHTGVDWIAQRGADCAAFLASDDAIWPRGWLRRRTARIDLPAFATMTATFKS